MLLVAGVLAWAVAVGCGGGGDQTETPPTTDNTTTTTTPPIDTTAVATTDPEAIYKAKCALCHGPSGMGDGPGAAALNPKPRNLQDTEYMKTRTDQELHDVIWNGKGAMPAWGKTGALTEEQVQAMVKYVRSLSHTG